MNGDSYGYAHTYAEAPTIFFDFASENAQGMKISAGVFPRQLKANNKSETGRAFSPLCLAFPLYYE